MRLLKNTGLSIPPANPVDLIPVSFDHKIVPSITTDIVD